MGRGTHSELQPVATLGPRRGRQYIFHQDERDSTTPPSILGFGGFYTEQESFGGGAGYLGHLDNDRWRLVAGAGAARINYDFFGVGNTLAQLNRSIPVEQDSAGGLVQLTRRIAPGWYIGPRLYYAHTQAHARLDESGLALPVNEVDVSTVALGIAIEADSRDNTFYPTKGQFLKATLDLFDGAFGSDFDYQVAEIGYNYYIPVHAHGVLALRAYGGFAFDDVPFFDLSLFGQHNDLRGYKSGKYRDRMQLSTQGEYRHQLNDWLGFAVFAGVGEVAPELDEFSSNDLLWSGGAGLRFRIARENPVDFRVDLAYGDDGRAFYVGVGQAF